MDEQRRIAAILDQADALRAKRRQVLAHLDALTQSIFQDMFMGGGGWPEAAIGVLGKVVTGKTPPSAKANMFGGPIPFVTPGDLGSGAMVARWLSKEGSDESRVVRQGASLVCCIGATIGKIDFARAPSAFNQQINAVEWNSEIDDIYGLEALRRIKNTIIARAGITTLPLLPKSQFAKLRIPVASLSLQRVFAQSARAIDESKRTVIQSLGAHDELFSTLQSRAFQGEV